MRLAHLARHLCVTRIAPSCFKPRSSFQERSYFSMESFLVGDSLAAAVRRLSTYESARKYSPCAPKEAAVLVPLFEDDEGTVKVVLTERSHKLKTHAGEVAFPGGKRDPEDATIQSTALREAQEEMGLDPKDVEVVAQLAPILSRHHLSVTPIVGVIPAEVVPSLVPFPAEVASIFTVPLHYFLEDHPRHSYEDARMAKFRYRIHHFEHEGYDIWGLTGGMLINVAEIAFGRSAEFDVTGKATDYAQLYFDGSQVRVEGSEGESDVCYLVETKPAKRRRSQTQPQPSLQ